MLHDAVLAVHIVAGVAGLLLGGAGLGRPERLARWPYQSAVAVVTVGAVALAAMDWAGLWPFVILAVGTEAAALGAWWLHRRRPRKWEPWYLRLAYGTCVSLVTALLVVSWPSVVSWLLPTLVGAPRIERAALQASRRSLA
ncbi:MAG TPA: hypothetical protein VF244_00810 [Acidimicrobiales bacterium]